MHWHLYFSLFGFSMIKFMFAPFSGPLLKLSFLETYLSCVAGAVVAAFIFYFSAELLLIRSHRNKVAKRMQAISKGIVLKEKKKFTRTNKTIVRMKHRFGVWVVGIYAPLFLSVPVGSIITAKFFGKEKRTFPIIILGIFINGLMTTSIAYLFFGPK
jgi:CBS domain containing-hemolysin-like protein